jgi:hypothetical protein
MGCFSINADNDSQPIPQSAYQSDEERFNTVDPMPDTVPSTNIGKSSVNRSEYALLRARYFEPRERSGAELPNGLRLRKHNSTRRN